MLDMQNPRQMNIQLINLKYSSFLLNQQNQFTSKLQLTSNQINKQIHHLKHQKLSQQTTSTLLFTIQFNLIQLQPLTPLKPQINLFQIYINSLDIQIKSQLKLSHLFQLHTLSYFIQIQSFLLSNYFTQKAYIQVKTTQFTTYQQHQVKINFLINSTQYSSQLTTQLNSILILGNKSNKWPFKISNFHASIKQNTQNKQFQNSLQKTLIKNLSIPNDFSYPLIDKLQLQQQNIELKQKIKQLHSYSSPQISQYSSNQLYICHDMKGGYLQDLNSYSPIGNDSKGYHYRYNYFSQTKIFNYFSHYPITIPPKMWRQVCKKYHVLCLGTFIVQPNDYFQQQSDYLTQQFALKLIYIAKKARFDGYLINIQVPIQNPNKLISWLKFLTQQINKQILNSQIIWYDSILMNGQITYQNQLNNHNQPFYLASNGIFTNYWWNQNSLINSLKYKVPQKSIYIGNDCFGRNTYAGGKYQIVKAINKIQKLGKQQLAPVLFAPGFTYEDNAQKNRQNFLQNQIKMYHGNIIETRPIQKWKYTLQGGNGWKQQDQWWVTSYQLCKRQALIKITDFKGTSAILSVLFSCYVSGKGPNFADYYKITLQFYDYKEDRVLLSSNYPKTITAQNQQYIELRMNINCGKITDATCLRVLQEGKDSQFWAGHYGAQFKGEKVALIIQSDQRRWINNIPVSSCRLSSNGYITFFNRGQGDYFYYKGDKMQKNYNSLKDYDVPPVMVLNNLSNVQITYSDSYIGGNCLKYQNANKITLNQFVLVQKMNKIFKVVIVCKNTQLIQINCHNLKSNFKKLLNKDQKQQNGWKTYESEINLNELKQQRFKVQVVFSKDNGLIGQFSLIAINNQKKIQAKIKTNIKIQLNKQSTNILPYYVDIQINGQYQQSCKDITSLLLKIGQFRGFIKCQSINNQQQNKQRHIIYGLLKKIPILSHKTQSFDIQIIDLSKKTQQQNLLFKSITIHQFKKIFINQYLNIQFQL